MNPQDAEKIGLNEGEIVDISSRRGSVRVKVNITDICSPGTVSMTFHFFESPANELTHAALDPISKIPETKVCAVKVTKI
jgi:anaerobic selenocysteine-containing dehydrogenase